MIGARFKSLLVILLVSVLISAATVARGCPFLFSGSADIQ